MHEFGSVDSREFLHGLDAYVYFHSSRWIEAFGYSVLESLASGLPTIVSRSFEPLFADGAIYAKPAEVREVLAGRVLGGPTRMEAIARQLALTPRTLQRWLAALDQRGQLPAAVVAGIDPCCPDASSLINCAHRSNLGSRGG